MKPTQIRSRKVFLVTVEVLQKGYDYKVGDICQFVIITPSTRSLESILSRYYNGSEYINYKILSAKPIGDNNLFQNTINL